MWTLLQNMHISNAALVQMSLDECRWWVCFEFATTLFFVTEITRSSAYLQWGLVQTDVASVIRCISRPTITNIYCLPRLDLSSSTLVDMA